ncbi:MAG: YraN family protein [Fulvivirga sp.]|nr:YraN family protein [Fulvivirga sp.]
MSLAVGKTGEAKACSYLRDQGYAILETNYRFKRNEIDIIASKNGTLVFVEVKSKSYNRFGHPEDMVDEPKAERIMETAEQYIYENDWTGNIRFDVLALIIKDRMVCEITHFEDAFH